VSVVATVETAQGRMTIKLGIDTLIASILVFLFFSYRYVWQMRALCVAARCKLHSVVCFPGMRTAITVCLFFVSTTTSFSTKRVRMLCLAFPGCLQPSFYALGNYTVYQRNVPPLTCYIIIFALWNRADHYIFMLWFVLLLLLSCFPRLISAAADWMSAILPHMVWP